MVSNSASSTRDSVSSDFQSGWKEGKWLTGGTLGSPLPCSPLCLVFVPVPERIQSKISLFLKTVLWNRQVNRVGSERQPLPLEQVLVATVASHLYPLPSPEQRVGLFTCLSCLQGQQGRSWPARLRGRAGYPRLTGQYPGVTHAL